MVERDRQDDNTAYAHCMLDNYGCDARSEYIILIALKPRPTQVFRADDDDDNALTLQQ